MNKFENKWYTAWYILSRTLLTLALAACSHWHLVRKHNNTSPSLQPYVKEFSELTNREVKIHLNFENLDQSTAGICYYRLVGNEISINAERWAKYTEEQKRFLVFHELSHCVCNTGHTEDSTEQLCSDHYMNPFLQADYCIKENKQKYIQQLKQDCAK